jgi:hypothetical protein
MGYINQYKNKLIQFIHSFTPTFIDYVATKMVLLPLPAVIFHTGIGL